MNSLLQHPKPKKKIVWDFSQNHLVHLENLATVCQHSRCPNRAECSAEKTATFMIGGEHCTRNCQFCHVTNQKPLPMVSLMQTEIDELDNFFKNNNLQHVVLTSVTRDDQEQLLAEHFANAVDLIHQYQRSAELLIPDFHAQEKYLDIVLNSAPEVLSHNMETVQRLSKNIRPQANYQRSLAVLEYIHSRSPQTVSKSGFMVGMGETLEEIDQLLFDLSSKQVDIVTIGQYLQPSNKQLKVQQFYTDEQWEEVKQVAKQYSFNALECGTYVRSSYKAYSSYKRALENREAKHEYTSC